MRHRIKLSKSLSEKGVFYFHFIKMTSNNSAKKMMVMMLVVVVVVLASTVAIFAIDTNAQVTDICGVPYDDLVKCRPSVTPPDPTPPTSECCATLKMADLSCLCSYKNSPLLPILNIDPNLAVALPAQCGLQLPPDCRGSADD